MIKPFTALAVTFAVLSFATDPGCVEADVDVDVHPRSINHYTLSLEACIDTALAHN